MYHLDDNDFDNETHDCINDDIDIYTLQNQVNDQVSNKDVKKLYDNYNFLLSERDFYPPEDKRYLIDKNGFLGSKNMYVQYLSEFYDYYKECFEDMFEE